jgi:hypothetical protein
MIVHEKNKDRITISFPSTVGRKGLMRIKNFVEFLEKSGSSGKKKTYHSIINSLADNVNEAAWKKVRKVKGL